MRTTCRLSSGRPAGGPGTPSAGSSGGWRQYRTVEAVMRGDGTVYLRRWRRGGGVAMVRPWISYWRSNHCFREKAAWIVAEDDAPTEGGDERGPEAASSAPRGDPGRHVRDARSGSGDCRPGPGGLSGEPPARRQTRPREHRAALREAQEPDRVSPRRGHHAAPAR